MVKIYLKYQLRRAFGVITSATCNVLLDKQGQTALTGSLENIALWNIRRGDLIAELGPGSAVTNKRQAVVTRLALSPNGKQLAAGYGDGAIRIWEVASKSCLHTFRGHKGDITAFAFTKDGHQLASAGADTDVIIWDLVGDTGMFRLRGHKNAITDVKYIEKDNLKLLVTSSKDFLLKIWDLATQHCIQTIIGHRAEVWSFDINPQQDRLVTVCENQLRFFKILDQVSSSAPAAGAATKEAMDVDADLTTETDKIAVFYGVIDRKTKERASTLRFDDSGSILAVQSAGKVIEFLKVHDDEEKKQKKKKRKRREKKKQQNATEGTAATESAEDLPTDEFSHKLVLRTNHKISSFCFSTPKSKELLISLQNNSLEMYKIKLTAGDEAEEEGEAAEKAEDEVKESKVSERVSTVELPGHRHDIRAVALNSNDEMLLTLSNAQLKLWNIRTQNCIRTIKSGYGLCGMFIPGDRHALVGTKTGGIEVYDLQAASQSSVVEAHTGAVWGLQLLPNKSGVVSAGEDKMVKFWEFELRKNIKTGVQTLSLSQTKAEEQPDSIISMKFSPDGKYIALALLDTTVRICFADSMKLYLNLYGHKLPVMTLDMSDDGALIATGSADKNIKIWGMDFGDCHKSIFAHDDSVMQVAFVPQTHYFFSAGKDGVLKYWDADKYENILVLDGHQGQIWTMAISHLGDFVVTGSQDKSIRIWDRTEEQIFLEEQREMELEQAWENTLEEEDRYQVQDKSETGKATRKTLESIKAGERLLEALNVVKVEEENAELYRKELARFEKQEVALAPNLPNPNALLLGRTPTEFLLQTFKSIKSAELEEALLILPFTTVLQLLNYLNQWIGLGLELELSTRVLHLVLQVHQVQISANRSVQPTVHSLRDHTRRQLMAQKDTIGYNLAGLNYLKRQLEANSDAAFYQVREKLAEIKAKQKKRKRNYWEDEPAQ